MIKSIKGLLFLIILFSTSIITGQTITGKVIGGDLPIPGVNIVIKETTKGVVTDFDGNYSISDVKKGSILVFSSIGFLTQEILVINQSTIDVVLIEDIESLDEVVVVGYGTQSRAKVSTAISSVNSDDISENAVIGVDQALQGRAAGVTVQSGGSPGQAPTVRIRGLSTFGSGDPFYVVDGVFITDINNINPSSIDRVSILKDAAAAAIYGARGSNGVVIITTKKGKSGWSKLKLNTYTGFQNFNNFYDLLSASEYREYAGRFGNLPRRFTDSQFAETVSQTDTDWQDQIFRTASTSNIDLNYSGGSDKINYYTYAGYLNTDGVIINTGYERYTFGVNSDIKVSDRFKIGETLGIGVSTQDQLNESGGRSLIEHTIKQSPVLGVFEPGTSNFQSPENPIDSNDAENPVRVQSLQERINKNTNLYSSFYGEYSIIKGLKFRQQVGVNLNYNNNNYISRRYQDGDYNSVLVPLADPLIPVVSDHAQPNNRITRSTNRFVSTILTSTLSYDVTIADKHDITATAVYEKFNSESESVDSASNASDNVDILTAANSVTSSRIEKDVLISYIGRLNYSFDDKYIATASIRRDGSSRFGAKEIWGTFPAASLAWRIDKEDFFSSGIVNNLKLRASYGVTGNNNIGFYQFQSSLFNFGSYILGDGNRLSTNTVSSGIADENLKWEESVKTNYGFDLGLFNDKLTLTAEYFTSKGEDLLVEVPAAPSIGVPNTSSNEDTSVLRTNAGEVDTKGFEVTLGYNDREGDFKWSANVNFSTSENEVVSTGNSDQIIRSRFEGEAVNIIRVGDPILSFFGWQTDGIFQNADEIANAPIDSGIASRAPGDIRFKDVNGDGVVDDNDRTIIGNPFPDFTYGVDLSASYKGFDATVLLYGVQGNDVFNSNLFDIDGSGRLFNASKSVLNAWTPENTNTTQPRIVNGDPNRNVRVSDRYIEDGSFLRVKNITLGYSIPEKFLKSIANNTFSKIRVYAQGQNLLTFTNYRGYDPEVPARREDPIFNRGGVQELGLDRGFYPTPRTLLMGVQIEF